MLSFLKDEAAVGWYNAACTLSITIFTLVGVGFARALSPSIARTYVFDSSIYSALIERAVRYSVMLLVPVGVGITLLAHKIIAIVFGPQFANSASALQLLIWSSILFFLNFFYLHVLEVTGRQKKATILLGIGAAATIALNLLLIPKFSFMGAAIASLITQLACLIAACYVIGKTNHMKRLAHFTLKPVIASVPMAVVVFFLSNLHAIPLVLLAAFLYFLALYLIRGITKEDRKTLLDSIGLNRRQR
jgi:O-antigen/teichoic acid export membrane protein